MNHRLRSLLWGVLAALIASGVMVQIQASGFDFACKTQPGGCGKLEKPILSAELARDGGAFRTIIDQGERSLNIQVVRTNTYMDFLFILLYWLVFVLFGRYYNNRWSTWVMVFISAAAVSDLLENWRILACLRELEQTSTVHGLTPAVFGYPKWAFFGAAVIMLGLLIKAPGEERHRTLAWILIVAGVLVLAGLPMKFVMLGLLLFTAGILLALVLYFPLRKSARQV